jgi:hypothetical protein
LREVSLEKGDEVLAVFLSREQYSAPQFPSVEKAHSLVCTHYFIRIPIHDASND